MARSVTETAVGDVPDAALQLLPPHFAALPLLPASLVSDTIRTLRILNSKLQNMLSGRYKSKVGPARVRRSPRGERVLYPLSPSPGFYGARGKGFLRVLHSQPGPKYKERDPHHESRTREKGSFSPSHAARWCSLQTEQMDRKTRTRDINRPDWRAIYLPN